MTATKGKWKKIVGEAQQPWARKAKRPYCPKPEALTVAKKVRTLSEGVQHHLKFELCNVCLCWWLEGLKLIAIGRHRTETNLGSVWLEKDEVEATRSRVVNFDSSV